MACHCAGVAEAEVDVAISVHVEKLGAASVAHERWKSAGPFGHPVHGHSAEQRLAGALKQGLGFRPFVNELLLFGLHQGLQAVTIDCGHSSSEAVAKFAVRGAGDCS